ncbi:DNA repair and recombination protein Rad52p [[Candida] railenensis]|uniref:DNA repair and recombination protein RAD52 n=1 Tax=[Candida] railenensis TaxID=45579 RepID=A0A9P0QLZ9_9ASCO|nr:DNA repair and recombination protein Rad52p [[Candida] railenensis]
MSNQNFRNGGPTNGLPSSTPNYKFTPFNETKYKPNGAQSQAFKSIPYTVEEHKRISEALDKVLGPEYVSFRPGGGGQKVSYIEGWKALNLANEIFGFNGWCSELISSQVDYFDTHGNTGRISMGLSVVVRITIRDGTYHEDFGYGYIENAKNKAMAFEKCKKEAFTDGLKRCLRCFGNVLGNCLYDRTIIPKIQKVKLPPTELDHSHFHRDPLVVERERKRQRVESSSKLELHQEPKSTQAQVDHKQQQQKNHANGAAASTITPTGTASSSGSVIGSTSSMRPPDKPKTRKSSSDPPSNDQPNQGYDIAVDDFDDSFVFSDDNPPIDDDKMSQNDGLDEYELEMLLSKNMEQGGVEDPAIIARSLKYAQPPTKTPKNLTNANANADTSSESIAITDKNIDEPDIIPEMVTFVSAKAADLIRKNPIALDDPSKVPQFDPKFVSSSMRRTVDPTKSTPIKRTTNQPVPARSPLANNATPINPGTSSIATSPSNNESTTPVLGKRLLGLPPSQRSAYKRTHSTRSQSLVDKENQPETSQ